MPNYTAILAGTGSYVPEKRLTNDDLSKLVDTNDEWITQRTGIRERRIVAQGESTATMASHAATRALKAASLEPKDLDLILVATIVPEMLTPSTACFVAASLGLSRTPAYDMSAACSGFVYAMDQADAFIRSGKYKNVLVIGAETLSKITDYTDRGSCILFGDAAGAAVFTRGENTDRGIKHISIYSDGSGWELIHCPMGARHPVDEKLVAARNQYLKLRGREVFKWAVSKFVELAHESLEKTGLTLDQIKLVVPHQSNQRIIEAAMDKLGLPMDKAVVNIDRYGNTSAASVPLALDETIRAGKLEKGDHALFIAMGGGLTWGSCVLKV
jgi:3-oxoacyl-[acyl-carrier-protein] synthase III